MKIIYVLFFFILLAKLNVHATERVYNLSLSYRGAIDSRLRDSCWLYQNDSIISGKWQHNEGNLESFFCFNNLRRGLYTLATRDIFGKRHLTPVSINKDSILRIERFSNYLFDTISKSDMLNATEITLIYKVKGCFTDFTGKAKFTKLRNSNTYRMVIDATQNNPPLYNNNVEPSMIDDLYKLQCQSDSLRHFAASNISTTSRYLYILVGNKVYRFVDRSSSVGIDFYFPLVNKHIRQKIVQ